MPTLDAKPEVSISAPTPPAVPELGVAALRAPVAIHSQGLTQRSKDRLAWLCHTIVARQFRADSEGYVPLDSLILRAYLGRPGVGEFAENLIECDGKYYPRVRCKGYRLGPALSGQPFSDYYPSQRFARRLARLAEQHSRAVRAELPPGAECIYDSLDRFTFDPSVWDYLGGIDWESRAALSAKRNGRRKVNPLLAKESCTMLCRSIHHRRPFAPTLHLETGRLYHAVANLPKDIRAFGRLDGMQCTEIDISSSQPYFLSSLHPDKSSAEFFRYVDAISTGRFYNDLAEAAGKPGDREWAKRRFIVDVLFGESRYEGTVKAAFAKMCPILSDWINRTKEGSNNALALLLQRREADVLIGKVVPRLAKAFPGVPFLPIHDSIMAPTEFLNPFINLMRKTIVEATEIQVFLNVD